jgi:hypothetical protein
LKGKKECGGQEGGDTYILDALGEEKGALKSDNIIVE